MKSNDPPLPSELRKAIEDVLVDGETLSSFIEGAVRRKVEHRRISSETLRRAHVALANFERSGQSVPAEAVHASLEAHLAAARRRLKT